MHIYVRRKNIWKATQQTLNLGQEIGDGSEEGLLQKEEEGRGGGSEERRLRRDRREGGRRGEGEKQM